MPRMQRKTHQGDNSPLYCNVRGSFLCFRCDSEDATVLDRSSSAPPSLRGSQTTSNRVPPLYSWVWSNANRLPFLLPASPSSSKPTTSLDSKGPRPFRGECTDPFVSSSRRCEIQGKEVLSSHQVGSGASSSGQFAQGHLQDSMLPARERQCSNKAGESFGVGHEHAEDQDLDIDDVQTVMIKNVPYVTTHEAILDVIDFLGFEGQYHFFHLPRRGRKTMGYCFIGFRDPEVTKAFAAAMTGYRFKSLNTQRTGKEVEIVPAHIQGLGDCFKHFKSKQVMSSTSGYFYLERSENDA